MFMLFLLFLGRTWFYIILFIKDKKPIILTQ